MLPPSQQTASLADSRRGLLRRLVAGIELGQHLRRVLAQQRCRPAHAAGRGGDLRVAQALVATMATINVTPPARRTIPADEPEPLSKLVTPPTEGRSDGIRQSILGKSMLLAETWTGEVLRRASTSAGVVTIPASISSAAQPTA